VSLPHFKPLQAEGGKVLQVDDMITKNRSHICCIIIFSIISAISLRFINLPSNKWPDIVQIRKNFEKFMLKIENNHQPRHFLPFLLTFDIEPPAGEFSLAHPMFRTNVGNWSMAVDKVRISV
jgi:hypothetical protein